MASPVGRDFSSMFVREARTGSYPFPKLELEGLGSNGNGAGNGRVSIQELADILQAAASGSVAA